MENQCSKTRRLKEVVIFAADAGQVLIVRHQKLMIEVTANYDQKKEVFNIDFDSEEERENAFEIFSLKRAKNILDYLKRHDE